MNERIKQLLGQAYDEAVPETWTTLSSEQLGRIYEKFAELIVKDVRWVMQTAADDFILDKNYDAVKGVGRCMRRVKQHFGVTE